mmetsp:Transcript_26784/g.43287  ORF Transcript_26784/g.43287 Transcript_26784/m.43287 type:complete len:223 (+) Transcript_26784:598-1266(+)
MEVFRGKHAQGDFHQREGSSRNVREIATVVVQSADRTCKGDDQKNQGADEQAELAENTAADQGEGGDLHREDGQIQQQGPVEQHRHHGQGGVDFDVGLSITVLREELSLVVDAMEYGILGAKDQQAKHQSQIADLHHVGQVLRERNHFEQSNNVTTSAIRDQATHLVYKELTHAEDIDQDATGKDRDPLSIGLVAGVLMQLWQDGLPRDEHREGKEEVAPSQ